MRQKSNGSKQNWSARLSRRAEGIRFRMPFFIRLSGKRRWQKADDGGLPVWEFIENIFRFGYNRNRIKMTENNIKTETE